ncbi:MAG: hypothetical protein ABI567_07545 [Gammaproteobacteria bacterium]
MPLASKLKTAAGIAALCVPVLALYARLATLGPATGVLPPFAASGSLGLAGLGSFLLGWTVIARWSFSGPAD